MAKKEIIFSAKLQTAEFDQALKAMQSRVDRAYGVGGGTAEQIRLADRMKALGIQAPGSPSSRQADNDAKRSARELEGIIRDQWKQARNLNKEMDQRLARLKEIKREEQDIVRAGKDATEVKQRAANMENELRRKEAEHEVAMRGLRAAVSSREDVVRPQGLARLSAAYSGGSMGKQGLASIAGGIGGMGTAGFRMAGGGTGLGLGALGLLSMGIQAIDPVVRSIAAQPRMMAAAQGSAMQGLSGPLQDIYGGSGATGAFFAKERATAMARAASEMQTNRSMDQYSPWAGIGAKTAAGAAGGAGLGALFGGVGAAPGALLGAAGGLAKGVYDVASDPLQRNIAIYQMTGSSTAKKNIEAQYAQRFSQMFNENLESEKQKDPLKVLAEQKYRQEYSGNLDFQRKMGFTNEQFYGSGGFLERGTGAGFTREEMMGQASNIMSAGGSTRAAGGSAGFAAGLSRNMDLTNASTILGKLSGNLGGQAATEEATLKVLSEGVKLGLDKSEYREEQRRFAEVTATYIQQSGVTSAVGAARQAESMGSFFGGTPTIGAINQMAGAQQFIDTATSGGAGPRGAIFAAKLQGDQTLGGLGNRAKAALAGMSVGEITEDNPMVKAMAEDLGMTGEDGVKKFVTQARNLKLQSVTMTQNSEKALNKLRGMSDQAMEQDPGSVGRLLYSMGAEDSSVLHLTPEQQMGVARRLKRGEITPEDISEEAKKLRAKTTAPGGRMEDTEMAAVAAQQKIVNDQFREMAGSLHQAATAATAFNKEMLQIQLILGKAISEGKPLDDSAAKQVGNLYLQSIAKGAGASATVAPRSTKGN